MWERERERLPIQCFVMYVCVKSLHYLVWRCACACIIMCACMCVNCSQYTEFCSRCEIHVMYVYNNVKGKSIL